jgi:hypothetical protein
MEINFPRGTFGEIRRDEHGEPVWDDWPDEPPDDAEAPAPPPQDDERGRSWVPVDLEPILSGTFERPTTSVGLSRSDGLQLIYAGKEHTVIGEMESGKSWLLVACAAAELTKGNSVIYVHFEEADAADTVERLRLLSIPDEILRTRFYFVGPDEPITPTKLVALLDLAPVLVILDGVNEAMSMHHMGIRDEDGAAAYRRVLVKPFTRIGAAVLSADDVVKDKDKRGRDPLGSIHKGNGLTGSLILMENVAPFGRGERGASHVFVTKDRPGHLRRHGRPDRKMPGKTYMGTLIIDDTKAWVPFLDLSFLEPKSTSDSDEAKAEGAATPEDSDEATILATVTHIAESGREPNIRAIYATTTGLGKDRAGNAVERLLIRGALTETRGSRNARIFTVPERSSPEPT